MSVFKDVLSCLMIFSLSDVSLSGRGQWIRLHREFTFQKSQFQVRYLRVLIANLKGYVSFALYHEPCRHICQHCGSLFGSDLDAAGSLLATMLQKDSIASESLDSQ